MQTLIIMLSISITTQLITIWLVIRPKKIKGEFDSYYKLPQKLNTERLKETSKAISNDIDEAIKKNANP